MVLRITLCAALTTTLLLSSCGKKKEKELEKAFADLPQLETTTEKKDSADIFDEFYDEDEKKDAAGSMKKTMADDFVGGSTTEFVPDGRYVVQVSCVASRRLADKVAADLEAKGYPAYVAEVENPTPDLMGTYYRIRIGGFNYVGPARSFGENSLVPAGYDFWVDNRSNDNVGMGGYGLGESSVGEYGGGYSSPQPAPAASTSDSWGGSSTPVAPESYTEPAAATSAEPAPAPAPAAQPAPAAPAEPEATQAEVPAAEPAAEEKTAPGDDWGGTGDDWGDDSGW